MRKYRTKAKAKAVSMEALRRLWAKIKEEKAQLRRLHGNIKCGCGHQAKDHYGGWGFCHHSQHPRAGECGCTSFYPNDRYIIRKQKLKTENCKS